MKMRLSAEEGAAVVVHRQQRPCSQSYKFTASRCYSVCTRFLERLLQDQK